MDAQNQIQGQLTLEQSMANLLPLQWMYTQAQQNLLNMPMRCNYDTGVPLLNYPQPNMNYFMTAPDGSRFHPSQPYLPYSTPGDTFNQLYNHLQSDNLYPAQLGGSMQQGYNGHQPVFPCMPQPMPIHYTSLPIYQRGPMQPAYYGNPPLNMRYVHQVDMQNPYYGGTPVHNVEPSAIHLNNNVYNNKHIFVNGALYNTELINSLGDFNPIAQNRSLDGDLFEDEGYDPMDDDLPLIYGIRFYNPNYGPEGAIPPRSKKNRKQNWNNPYNGVISYPQHICNWLRSKYTSPEACIANGTQNVDLFAQDKIFNDLFEQKTNQDIANDGQNFLVSMPPNLKTKRRQGRGRSRNAHTGKKNRLAAADISLFENNSEWKKIDNIETDELNSANFNR